MKRQTPRTKVAVRELCAAWDLQWEYTDVFEKKHRAGLETARALLHALGCELKEDFSNASSLLKERPPQSLLAPVTPVWSREEGEKLSVPLQVSGAAPSCLEYQLYCENGEVLSGRQRETRGITTFRLPARVPTGYHRLSLQTPSGSGKDRETSEGWVFKAPLHAYSKKSHSRKHPDWGMFFPLYALQTRQSEGIGDYRDLATMGTWLKKHGADQMGLLPLYPSFHEGALEDPSPYRPVSRLFWNTLALCTNDCPGWENNDEARKLAESEDWLSDRLRLNAESHVDYRAVFKRKDKLLRQLAKGFLQQSGQLEEEFRSFVAARPLLADYARFLALYKKFDSAWRSWPVGESRCEPEERNYHLYLQWAAHRQLQNIGKQSSGIVPLYLDLPLGVHPDGFDTWRFPEQFLFGVSAGAPPDMLFEKGQSWGFPPFHPRAIRESGYAHFRELLSHVMAQAGTLRLDHVMGLHRIYCVPEGNQGTSGMYLKYRPDEWYAVLSIESHRNRTMLVGEDLGTVPPAVRAGMKKHHVRRMYVVEYEVQPEDPPLNPVPEHSLATLNTHDMWPFHGFWSGEDIATRQTLGWLSREEADNQARDRKLARRRLFAFLKDSTLRQAKPSADDAFMAAVSWLMHSRADLVLIDLESLWGETRPVNIPGPSSYPNWRRKLRDPFEVFSRSRRVNDGLALFKGAGSRPFVPRTVEGARI